MEKFEGTSSAKTLNLIRSNLDQQEIRELSPYAVRSVSGVRRRTETASEPDYRPPFSIDADRILHSSSYTRYIDKTQVFYLVKNDHITHRVLHVQLVSKIARTIGRFLRLNADLIEAIALGHDIGHSPFGHDGEKFLSQLCINAGIGYFSHNIQSVQFLERVERQGAGWNLCLQTLDGILCHDGEVHDQALEPQTDKRFADLASEIEQKKSDPRARLVPMTLEGCVVRLADTIAYIGRDIEDAIRLKIIRRSDLPGECVDVLGETNGTIVYNLVTDVIDNSHQKPYVGFSPEISEGLRRLKNFNLERIYRNPEIKRHTDVIRELFFILFGKYCEAIDKNDRSSVIFTDFLADKLDIYIHSHKKEEMVRDFIAGMTDRYFLRQCPAQMREAMMDS